MLITTHNNDRAQRFSGALESVQPERYEHSAARAFDQPAG